MKLDPVLFGGTERHSFGEITFECLGGGLVGHFPSAARSSLRQGRGPQRRARLASRLFTSSFPRGRARRRCSLGGAPPPSFLACDEAPGEADSRAAGVRRVVLKAAYLVQLSAVGLPLADELWIKGPFRGATLDTAKRAEASERLVQRSPAGETEEWLPRVIVLVFLVGPACQLPQSPLSFPSLEP